MGTITVFQEKLEKEADFRQWLQKTGAFEGVRPWIQQHFGKGGVLGGVDPRWWSTPIMMVLSALAAKSAGAGNWGTLGAALGGAGAGFAGGNVVRQLAQPGELKPGWWQEPYKGWLNSLTQQQPQQPAQTTLGQQLPSTERFGAPAYRQAQQ